MTAELILKDRVHLVVAGNTPETTVPVADQCELNGIPCITDDTPWQPQNLHLPHTPHKPSPPPPGGPRPRAWSSRRMTCTTSSGKRTRAAPSLASRQLPPQVDPAPLPPEVQKPSPSPQPPVPPHPHHRFQAQPPHPKEEPGRTKSRVRSHPYPEGPAHPEGQRGQEAQGQEGEAFLPLAPP